MTRIVLYVLIVLYKLELNCDGYGPKPGWMDKGPLEKERSLKARLIVSQTKSKRQRQRMLCTSRQLAPGLDPLLIGSASFSSPIEKIAVTQDNTATHEFELHNVSAGDLMCSESISNAGLPGEFFLSQQGGISTSDRRVLDAATAIENTDV